MRKLIYALLIIALFATPVMAEGYRAPLMYGTSYDGLPFVRFDLGETTTCQEGLIKWNDDDKTMDICTENPEVTIQSGQEMHVRGTNKTGTTLTNGQVVFINGAQGNRPTFALANAVAESTSSKTIGIVTADILHNDTGYVTTTGLVRDIDTSTIIVGNTVWLDTTPGDYTDEMPATPNHATFLGICVRSSSDEGIIYVKPQNGFEWYELHDVDTINAIANDIALFNGVAWSQWSPAYGTLELENSLSSVAASNTIYNGTVAAGTVINTTTIDGTYLQVEESGQFLIDFTFALGTNSPAVVDIVGRYVGNPAHNVKAKVYNTSTSDWIDMTSDSNDFPASANDASFRFPFPDLVNYLSGGNAIVRIDHESSAVGSHDMYIDYINVETAAVSMPVAGTFYLINSGAAGTSLNTTLSADDGSITISEAGNYLPSVSISFTGFAGEQGNDYHIHVFVNGVEQYKSGILRTISDSTDVGSGHGNGSLTLAANDVVTVKAKSNLDNAYISLEHFAFTLTRQIGQ